MTTTFKHHRTIGLLHLSRCDRYHARMVWQTLFDYYRANGGDLHHMDNMLCDYDQLKKVIENGVRFASWSFDGWVTDMYYCDDYDDTSLFLDAMLLIEFAANDITISEVITKE